MRILLVHSDYIEFEPKEKAFKGAEDAQKKKERIDDCLVVFTAVEKGDERSKDVIVQKGTAEITDVCRQVKATTVVLYPFVHLSSSPAPANDALDIMKGMEAALASAYTVHRAPFGWYKSFTVKCKGHPLSELSKEIRVSKDEKKEIVSEAVQKESQLVSHWYVLDLQGRLHKLSLKDGDVVGFDFTAHRRLETFCRYEMAKSRIVDKEPPHIKLMRRLQLVDYEEGSDPGNFRFLPNGRLVKSLLEDYVTRTMVENGALEVETPIMYDYEHPSLKSYLNRFPARQYTIETPNKRVFLRFSACFGQFLIAHDMNISYKDLPLWLYELTRYSFRVEQRGELAGLRRLRAFTMPDCHSLCADMTQAKQDMRRRFEIAKQVQEKIGLSVGDDLELGIRVVKDFYDENKEFVTQLVNDFGKPCLVEMWDKRFFYFVMKYEFNFVDALDKAAALTTDQIDVENGERYGIRYQDKDNTAKTPIILHLSPSGAIERVIYALLEKSHMQQEKGANPTLPLWLTPTQVRLCPVNDSFIDYCTDVAQRIASQNVRVDVDDRTESIGKKIRDAETEWVPLIVVVGEKEKASGAFAVRFRESGEVKNLSLDELVSTVRDKTADMPFRLLSLPRLLSKRPVFIG